MVTKFDRKNNYYYKKIVNLYLLITTSRIMKKALKTLVVAAAMLIGTQAFGQITFTFGYEQPSYSGDEISWNYNGFYTGILTQFNISDVVYFEPGLLFDMAFKDGDNISYLRLPLHIGAGMALGNGFDLFATAGPGLSVGLFGTDDPFDYYNRFDVNFGLEAGIRLNSKYEFRFGYDWGLLKAIDDTKVHRNIIHAGLAYCF